MLLHVGQLSLGTAVPGLSAQLEGAALDLAGTIAAAESEARALASDIASLSSDLTAALASQLDVQATVDAAAAQLASLPGAALSGVQDAIGAILSGDALAGLQAAVASLPDTLKAGLEAAAQGPQAQLAEIAAQVNALQARIAALQSRGLGLASRLQALSGARLALEERRAELLVGGIDAYVYAGPTTAFGGELDAGLRADYPGDPGLAGALILVCQAGPAWAALGRVLKVTP